MMTFLIELFVVLFFSADMNATSAAKDTFVQQTMLEKNENSKALGKVLYQELEQMIAHTDSLQKKSSNKDELYDIYVIHFYNEGEDCCILMGPTIYYNSKNIKGHTIVKDKLIVFYNPESNCNTNLVNMDALEHTLPTNFPDENSDIALYTNFDPRGRKYKIHNQDSLSLIFNGSL